MSGRQALDEDEREASIGEAERALGEHTASVSSAKISPRSERSRNATAPTTSASSAAEQAADRDGQEEVDRRAGR